MNSTRRVAVAIVSAAVVCASLAHPAAPAGADTANGRVVYVSGIGDGTGTTYDIHVVDADGTNDVNLTPDPTPETPDESQDIMPEWSPDGARIAFVSNRVIDSNPDGNYEVFVMDADGSNVVQVTFAQAPNPWDFYQSYDPTWSPDGSQIAFSGYRQWSSSEVFVVPVDGSGAEAKVTDPLDFANKWQPDWSPDGTVILFTWGWDEFSQNLATIAPDGSNQVMLTDTSANAERQGVWSPDGTRIAFRWDKDSGNPEIYVLEYPSGVTTRVTDNPAIDEEPAWSPDGTEIVFSSTRSGTYDLYTIAAPPVPTATANRFAAFDVAAASTAEAREGPVAPLVAGSGDQQSPSWARAGIVSGAPTSTITKPIDGRTYSRLGTIVGTAADDAAVQRVHVALRRNLAGGATEWWTGSAWVAGSATSPHWLKARGTTSWRYRLPTLTSSVGTTIDSYTALSRATDADGNVESTFTPGRNEITFDVS